MKIAFFCKLCFYLIPWLFWCALCNVWTTLTETFVHLCYKSNKKNLQIIPKNAVEMRAVFFIQTGVESCLLCAGIPDNHKGFCVKVYNKGYETIQFSTTKKFHKTTYYLLLAQCRVELRVLTNTARSFAGIKIVFAGLTLPWKGIYIFL